MDRSDSRGSGKQHLPEPRFLAIARVVKPWGVHGEVKLQVLTSFPDQLDRLKRVYLGPKAVPHDVARFHWHSGELLLQLADVRDRNAAERLRDQLVQIRASRRPCRSSRASITSIRSSASMSSQPRASRWARWSEVLATGANDVYVVQGPRGEVLLPAASRSCARLTWRRAR